MKGYRSIRETSCKWGVSERLDNIMRHRDVSQMQIAGRSRLMREGPLIPA